MPPDYKFDIDFNDFLLNQAKAEIILQQLDNYQNVGIFETPFWIWSDITGAKVLRERVRKPIVEHFNEACLHAHACDGFAIAGSLPRSSARRRSRHRSINHSGFSWSAPASPPRSPPIWDRCFLKRNCCTSRPASCGNTTCSRRG